MIAWLQSRRKFLVIVLAITVFAFVGAGFVGWGSYSYGSKAAAVATVGEEKVTVEQFQQAYNSLYGFYSQFYDEGINGNIQKELQQMALNSLINEALLVNYARDLGLSVSKSEIAARIMGMEAFSREGRFDKEVYLSALKNARREVKEFEENMGRQILVDKLAYFLDMPASPSEQAVMAASMFMADRLVIKVLEAPKNLSITEAEAKAHYEANRFAYMGEPRYDVAYIKVAAQAQEATEAEAQEFYDRNRGRFLSEAGAPLAFEAVKNEAVLGAKMAKARREALKARIAWRDGKSEPNLIRGVAFSNPTLSIEVMQALESGQNKEILDPVETESGYVIARVENRYPPEPLPFAQARVQVEGELKAQKSARFLQEEGQKQLKDFKGKDLGFITRADAARIDGLNIYEANQLLEQVFASAEPQGVVSLGSKAVLYRILEQKLFDEAKAGEAAAMIKENVGRLKTGQVQADLLESLRNRYKINVY